VLNLAGALSQCEPIVQEKMLVHIARCDEEFGRRVAEGIGVAVPTELVAAGDD
jgi:catalase